MGEEEKAAQIGAAVTEYQAAKVECAHVDKKIESVSATYREAGAAMDKNRGSGSEPTITDTGIRFGYGNDRMDIRNLLNGSELFDLLQERDKARARVDKAKKAMNDLGITAVS